MQRQLFDDLFAQVRDSLPGNAEHLRADFEKNLQSLLTQALKRLNLVTREEFEVQRALLERSREKLEKLEKRLAELESPAPSRQA